MEDDTVSQDPKILYKFPNIACELLSCCNIQVMQFFEKVDENGSLVNLDYLFSKLGILDHSINEADFNYTRCGYATKIVNNLINIKPLIFGKYILTKTGIFEGLLNNFYCRSIYNLVLNVISPVSSPIKDLEENNAVTENEEHLKLKLYSFSEIILLALTSANEENKIDVNINACSLLIALISKDSLSKSQYVTVFEDKMEMFVKKFLAKLGSHTNNRLCNVFLVYLEESFKNDKDFQTVLNKNSIITYFSMFQKSFMEVLSYQPISSSKRVNTYGHEINYVDLKLYKVIEVMIILLTECSVKGECVLKELEDPNFASLLYSMILQNKFNNILHNHIKKLLLLIIQINNENVFKVFFLENDKFIELLDCVKKNRENRVNKISNNFIGFLGQIMLIAKKIEETASTNRDLINKKSFWKDFKCSVYEKEILMENHILGDIYISQENENTNKHMYFSFESIAQKYKDFLECSIDSGKATTADSDSSTTENNYSTENEENENKNNCIIPEIMQEIRDHKENDQDLSFKDYNYWKPVIDVNIEDLLNEL